ncbi:MAG: tyrosine-protein phosphatase [Prevotella sp.]|nr:tyrosine-protein phosphatase [Prevotella sp.]
MADYYGRYLRVVANGLDCAGTSYHKWAVTEVSGGIVLRCIYNPSQIGYATQGYYVAINADGGLVLVEGLANAAVWQFVDAATQKSIVANAANARLAAIATSAGLTATNQSELETAIASMTSMDKTSEISNPTMFENTTGWTVNNIQGTAINNGSYRIQNAAGGQSMTTQTVTGLPAGLYKVTVQSFYRASVLDRCATFGNNGYTFSNAYFKANDNEVLIKDWYEISTDNHSKPTSRSQISDDYDENPKYTNTVYTYVGSDGKLDLTIAVPSFSAGDYPNWICFNNVKLTYYFNAEDLTAYEGMLASAVAVANAVTPLPNQAATDLQDIVSANNKTYTTSADYQTAINAIEDATTLAQSASAAYAEYLTMKAKIEAMRNQDVYTDEGDAASALTTAVSNVDDAIQIATLEEATATITTQKTALWSATLTFMKSVTINEGAGFDLTWMIQDADFSDSNYKNYWTETLASSTTVGVTNGVMRYYNSSFDLSQTLPYTLPAGAYRMKVDGFERTNDPMDTAWADYQAGNSIVTGTLYLNNNEQLIMNLFDVQSVTSSSLGGVTPDGASFYVANGSGAANNYLANGYYPNTLIAVLANDAAVTIGYRCANAKAWTCVDNFKLEYIGEAPQVTINVKADELTRLCVPFTLDVSDENVDELYAVGGVYEERAQIYPVNTVAPGTPCVVKFNSDTNSATMEQSLGSNKQFILPWYDGMLVSDVSNYTWLYCSGTASIPITAFNVLDSWDMQFEVNLENAAARKYLANVTYTGASDESEVAQYNVAPPVRRDIPNAVMIPVPAFETATATLFLRDFRDDLLAEVTVNQGETAAYLYNLLPQESYSYEIYDEESIIISEGRFNTTGRLRMVYAPSAYNIRDLGGKLTQDGQRTTYGHLFRGSTLNGYVNCTDEDLQRLRDLGVGGEIDLRWKADYDKDQGCGTSAFGFDEDYYFAAANDYTATNLNESGTQQRLKEEFDFILNHFRQDKGVYFHCAWGADRTGLLAFLLEGVLGVTLDEIYKDYELTSFSAAPGATNRLKSAFQDRIDVILALEGTTLRDKFENYFINQLGISSDDIAYFRSVMLELCLFDDSDNNEDIINKFNNTWCNITLKGRTFYQDGKWNTVCLPFDVTLADSPLADATAKSLENATITGTTVRLTFGDAVETLEAGTPYIIKWKDLGENARIINPVFKNVYIDTTKRNFRNDNVAFNGYYDAFYIDESLSYSNLYYMTANSILIRTGEPRIMKAFRAYFLFSEDALESREIVIDFGDSDSTGLTTVGVNDKDGAWYTTAGVRIAQPTQKGIYVKNGRKTVIR